ncbi:hypothetical protein PRIC1_006602 [Phytophthora ramorum]
MELQAFLDDLVWSDLVEPRHGAAPTPTSSGVKRVTPKQKIDALHAEVYALTTQLHALANHRLQSAPQTATTTSCLWQQIAARQLERRRNSESENAKLRKLMVLQTEEAKSLHGLLKRRTRLQMLEEMLGGATRKKQRVARPLAVDVQKRAGSFALMLRRVDELYGKMDALFEEKGMLSISCPGRRRWADNKVLTGMCFELTRREVVPFSVDMVKEAVWTALGQLELLGLRSASRFKADVHYREQTSEGDTETAMVGFLAIQSSANTTEVKVRKVVRRYVEGSRTVFIYQTFMEPRISNLAEPVGVSATSTLLLEICRESIAAFGEETTLIQSYFSSTRHDEGLAVGRKLRSAVNLNIAIDVWDESTSRIYNQVENILLDEACKKGGKLLK